ncbi:MAG: hypothetical protein DRO11_08545, partial [Methanobacteriota archaeon]
DYVGLSSQDLIKIATIVNGTERIVEQKPFSQSLNFVMQKGRIYNLIVDSTYGTYCFGSITPAQRTELGPFIITSLNFPEDVKVTYRYVLFYAYRDNYGNIIFQYQDKLGQTNSLTVTLKFINGTLVYQQTFTTNDLMLNLTSNENETYAIFAESQHASLGTLGWNDILVGKFASARNPWNLDILGSFPIPTKYLIPLLFLLCLMGCFSALTSAEGLFVTCVVAGVFAYIGWLPLSYTSIIIMLSLTVMYAIIQYKKKEGTRI